MERNIYLSFVFCSNLLLAWIQWDYYILKIILYYRYLIITYSWSVYYVFYSSFRLEFEDSACFPDSSVFGFKRLSLNKKIFVGLSFITLKWLSTGLMLIFSGYSTSSNESIISKPSNNLYPYLDWIVATKVYCRQ